MTPVPRSILIIVVCVLAGLALFGLVSGITTAMGRSAAPATGDAARPSSGDIQEAKPLETITPPPPVPEPEVEEEEEEEKPAEKAPPKLDLPPAPQPYTPPAQPAPLTPPPAPTPDLPPPPADGAPALY
jgi:hypothetical protein